MHTYHDAMLSNNPEPSPHARTSPPILLAGIACTLQGAWWRHDVQGCSSLGLGRRQGCGFAEARTNDSDTWHASLGCSFLSPSDARCVMHAQKRPRYVNIPITLCAHHVRRLSAGSKTGTQRVRPPNIPTSHRTRSSPHHMSNSRLKFASFRILGRSPWALDGQTRPPGMH
ncbi:hypothetical protein L227DRAFT_426785 [Lentinus tigrinus ALCF2SS1-6]|uniref:Uncharacterized protein n=1 Tax=Lentinus tigrinus ALCF2SS1-6 TaxID=1328759 RepID=A0A5C2RMR1_9APHY|nr:hypothetical protein L227DRAFT_426785 [Lentinus tigrinus ALCF2SS1-6]